ncbi:hypothetical protein Clacol_005396 [Clathrus columnatus]|uniref:GST C-terminal domain-containing protein n=1 Tax=Clathrus columnatus TaxID=1419009 RepID=A0AAV5ADA6_9AGAM|nr:hypothetical protein Clacol_005396 [Clathrus columnatus]
MSKSLTLYTFPSPHGKSVAVALEELELSCEPWDILAILCFDNKRPGRSPALVDHTNGDYAVFESSAILLYLAQRFDPQHKISFDPIKEFNLYNEDIQWLFFAHGGVGPISETKQLSNQTGTSDEVKRLYSVVEKRLEGREWLVGTHYGLADIKTFVWLMGGPFVEVELEPYPNIRAWIKRIQDRPKTYKGLGVPSRSKLEEQMKVDKEVSVDILAKHPALRDEGAADQAAVKTVSPV